MIDDKLLSFYIFGDSICFGQLVSAHQTWATQLAVELNAIPEFNDRVLIQNAGVNGNTTRQALERMHYDVTSHRPDFLMIQFGMNDCNYWATDISVPRVSKKAFAANLEEIMEKALVNGTRHCFLNTNHPSLKGAFDHYPARTYEQSNAEYNDVIRLVHQGMSRKDSVTLVDIEKSWKIWLGQNPSIQIPDVLCPDGIHLNKMGHSLYSQVIIPIVVRRLKAELQ